MKTVAEKLDDLRNQQIHDYCDRPWFADEDDGFVDRAEEMIADMKKEVIKFTIYGEPVAKGRAKFCVRGGHAIAYTPKATREAEGDFRSQSLPYRPKEIITGAISMSIIVYKPIPKSLSGKKAKAAIAGEILPITRPDFDNYAKLVCDSLNGIFWKDDSQIVDCRISKRYSDTPRIEVELEGK